ncbi:MAG TPA: hypothetical protein VIE43_12545 [Thermoanaerobaculia bacterium]|jgi:hypothetical protein|nr:hypothetical protein [Thermoanaerobaculia bacterium]
MSSVEKYAVDHRGAGWLAEDTYPGARRFVHVLHNVAKGSDLEVVILTNANSLETFRSLLAPAVEEARERDHADWFEERLAEAVGRIEANSWLRDGLNTLLIDSQWDWSEWQCFVQGTAITGAEG